MSSATVTERATGYPGMGVPGFATPTIGPPTAMPAGTNWLVVPRCTFRVEKCTGGFKVICACEDKTASSMVQNLCTMLAGGMCSCCVMLNGMTVCCYNFTMGMCRYESTPDGVSMTCTSGDPSCSAMLQACCDSLSIMMDSGCTCCFLVNNTPICCGTTESSRSTPKGKSGR
jgi:hypothetical protein